MLHKPGEAHALETAGVLPRLLFPTEVILHKWDSPDIDGPNKGKDGGEGKGGNGL